MDITVKSFTPAQSEIIKNICFRQLDSLRRLYNGTPKSNVDIEEILQQNNIKPQDFQDELENRKFKFKQVAKNHVTLATMSKEDLSIFRHILANIEDQYKDKYPKAISNLWQKLFFIEGMQNSISSN